MYDRVLLATDGTVLSQNAESHAIDLAKEHSATLHVLFVVDGSIYTAYSGDEYVDEAEGPEHELEELGKETIVDIRSIATDADVEITEAIKHDDPVETILDYGDRETSIWSYSGQNTGQQNTVHSWEALSTAYFD